MNHIIYNECIFGISFLPLLSGICTVPQDSHPVTFYVSWNLPIKNILCYNTLSSSPHTKNKSKILQLTALLWQSDKEISAFFIPIHISIYTFSPHKFKQYSIFSDPQAIHFYILICISLHLLFCFLYCFVFLA